MRIGKVEPSGRPVIWSSLKLGPDLTGHPSGSTFPILTMTLWKILFFYTVSRYDHVAHDLDKRSTHSEHYPHLDNWPFAKSITCVFPCGFLMSFYCNVTTAQLFDGPFECDFIMKKSANKCIVGPLAQGNCPLYTTGRLPGSPWPGYTFYTLNSTHLWIIAFSTQ